MAYLKTKSKNKITTDFRKISLKNRYNVKYNLAEKSATQN